MQDRGRHVLAVLGAALGRDDDLGQAATVRRRRSRDRLRIRLFERNELKPLTRAMRQACPIVSFRMILAPKMLMSGRS
jgi:hypothetical protein